MCFSSLVLSRWPKILKKHPKTLKHPLTPIGSCRDLHTGPYGTRTRNMFFAQTCKKKLKIGGTHVYIPPLTPDQPPL